MNLGKLICKLNQIEGLSVALNDILNLEVNATDDSEEPFNAVISLSQILRYKIKEVRADIVKCV